MRPNVGLAKLASTTRQVMSAGVNQWLPNRQEVSVLDAIAGPRNPPVATGAAHYCGEYRYQHCH